MARDTEANEQDREADLRALESALSQQFASFAWKPAATTSEAKDEESSAKQSKAAKKAKKDRKGKGKAIEMDTEQASSLPEGTDEADASTAMQFRLFANSASTSSAPLVRAASLEPVYSGPGRGRTLDVDDEDEGIVALRRQQIRDAAVEGDWIAERASAQYWAPPRPPSTDPRLLRKVALSEYLARPSIGFITCKRLSKAPDARVKVRTYPLQGKKRLASRLARRKPVQKPKVEKQPVEETVQSAGAATKVGKKPKRKSKKRRMYERIGQIQGK